MFGLNLHAVAMDNRHIVMSTYNKNIYIRISIVKSIQRDYKRCHALYFWAQLEVSISFSMFEIGIDPGLSFSLAFNLHYVCTHPFFRDQSKVK